MKIKLSLQHRRDGPPIFHPAGCSSEIGDKHVWLKWAEAARMRSRKSHATVFHPCDSNIFTHTNTYTPTEHTAHRSHTPGTTKWPALGEGRARRRADQAFLGQVEAYHVSLWGELAFTLSSTASLNVDSCMCDISPYMDNTGDPVNTVCGAAIKTRIVPMTKAGP